MTIDRPVVVYSSWRGLFASFSAPLLLLGVMAAAWWRAPQVTGGLIGVGMVMVFLLVVALFDYPLRAEIGPEGIERICLLRRRLIGWPAVQAIGRGRGAILSRSTLERASARAAGPLVAKMGRRTVLLIDRCESGAEHAAIGRVVEQYAPHVGLPPRPPVSAPPTDLYHRGRAERQDIG